MKRLMILAIICALAIILTGCGEEKKLVAQPVVEKPDTAENQSPYVAFARSQKFIGRVLKAPATAKWPDFFAEGCITAYDPASSRWIVVAYVDSQNSFGAMIRTEYGVKMGYLGGGKWELEDIKTSQR